MYGLSVHEAICRGLPALVTASAGVAERYPAALADLLIENPDDARELVDGLWRWRANADRYRTLVAPLAAAFRARSWEAMARDLVAHVECAA